MFLNVVNVCQSDIKPVFNLFLLLILFSFEILVYLYVYLLTFANQLTDFYMRATLARNGLK